LVSIVPQLALAQQGADTPAASESLARYVNTADPAFEWRVRREGKLGGTTATELIMTSQNWQGTKWQHQLYLLKPASWDGKSSHALLFITGGSWRDEYAAEPTGDESLPGEARLLALVAEKLQTPVAVLKQVPNQPLFENRYEDAIIALTFKKFIETGDDTWPLLLPMAKSAVRAMDATQAFAKQEWSADLKTFTVTGASKRGWTTWLTGAVDPRATAIAPMVIDMLNMPRQMKHQVDTWGDFSEQIEDYTQLNLQKQLDTPAGKQLQAIVDPYVYRKALVQPKLILLGTNDRYWPLDALNLYWDDLSGPKYILYLPNNGHGLNDYVRLIGTMAALHRSVIGTAAMPDMKWGFTEGADGVKLVVSADPVPAKVNIWHATSATRDFRDAKWTSVPSSSEGTSFAYQLAAPVSGYKAFYGEAEFGAGDDLFHLSTNVRILGANGAVEPGE